MEVKESDRVWVKEHYPELTLETSSGGEVVRGDFRFAAAWDQSRRIYLIDPALEESDGLIKIVDGYSIRISIDENKAPSVTETGGRILARARMLGVPPRDLHIYESGEVCPVGPFDMAELFSLQEFMDGPVLQFFYDQSYHERCGRWPRGQYLHGMLGKVENFYDQGEGRMKALTDRFLKTFNGKDDSDEAVLIRNLITGKERIHGHWPCLCGSGREFRSCHSSLFRGLWFLQEYVRGGRNSGKATF